MSKNAEQLIKDALTLPASDRAVLVEQLMISLDRPDPSLDALWAKEAEERIAAYSRGHLKSVPAEEVFAELEGM